MDGGLWTLDFGLWTMDHGLWKFGMVDAFTKCNAILKDKGLDQGIAATKKSFTPGAPGEAPAN